MRLRPCRIAENAVLVALAGVAGCAAGGPEVAPFPCPTEDPAARVDAVGVYRYASATFLLSGTITIAATASGVAVTGTSYDEGKDRPLVGPGVVAGNRLDLALSPSNGDRDYHAEVSLLFADGGHRFCLREFADSNGDRGGPGSYFGQRR